jgi:hypothetical protein
MPNRRATGPSYIEKKFLDAMAALHAEGRTLFADDVTRAAGVPYEYFSVYKRSLARKGLLDPAWAFARPGQQRRKAGGRPRRPKLAPIVKVEGPKVGREEIKRRMDRDIAQRRARAERRGRRRVVTCATMEEWRAKCGHLIHGA